MNNDSREYECSYNSTNGVNFSIYRGHKIAVMELQGTNSTRPWENLTYKINTGIHEEFALREQVNLFYYLSFNT